MPNAMRADITGIVMMIEFDSLEVADAFLLAMIIKLPKACGKLTHRQI